MTGPVASEGVDDAQLLIVHAAMCDAMVSADTGALEAILSDGFTLEHMTGYVQAKAEWLDEIASGGMRYSSVQNQRIAVEQVSGQPVVHARTVTVARIWGSSGTWRLRLCSWFTIEYGHPVIARTVASIW